MLLIFVSFSVISYTQNNDATAQGLSFKGKSNKETYLLGESVKVEFEFINKDETPIIVSKFGVDSGGLKIFIANENGEYNEYMASTWGRQTGALLSLKPTQSHKFEEVTILWKSIAKPYAFSEPGIYFIKGVSYIGEDATSIESEPIQIVVNEPIGDDLEVWNRIKGNRQIAYLMHNDEFNTSQLGDKFDINKNEDKDKLAEQVKRIVEKYPNSLYSEYLKRSIEKYKKSEVRRRESRKQFQDNQEKKP